VYVILGALVALVLLGVVYAEAVNDVAKRTTTLAAVTEQVGVIQTQAASFAPYTSFATLSQQRIDEVAALAEGRYDWSRAMAQIALALPPGVLLSSLSGTTGTGGGASGATGSAGTEAALGTAPSASFSLAGCTSSQLVVAQLLRRFRALDDVGSVTLPGYDKPAGVKVNARGGCTVTFSMTIDFDSGYGIPTPKLPAGVSTSG
jgi:Tfp pilus assembly protein PilN